MKDPKEKFSSSFSREQIEKASLWLARPPKTQPPNAASHAIPGRVERPMSTRVP